MFKRLLDIVDRGRSAFLFGPRGTGKTQWVKMAFPDALYGAAFKNGIAKIAITIGA